MWRLPGQKGAFDDQGLAAPDVADLCESMLKKKGTRSGAQPDDNVKSDDSQGEGVDDEANAEQGQREQKGNLLNEVARNRAVRSAQLTAGDLKQQMHLMITKGRAAAAELEVDADAARFRAEVSVLTWRLGAARVVMNVENKDIDQARLDLA